MRPFKSYLHLVSLSTLMAIMLVISSCGSATQSTSSKPTSQPAKIQSPTATSLSIRSMRVDLGGYQLYVRCMGQGTPTVLFEEGLGNDVSIWDHVQPEVAQFTQACAYDRANNGQSDKRPATIKISAQQIAKELHTLLLNGHIRGPYVLVGHSVGGLFAQMYASLYPQNVVGVVLVDSTHPEQSKRLAAALGPAFTIQARQSFPVEGMTYDDLLAIHVPLIVLVRSRFNSGPTWTADQLRQAWMSLQIDLSKRSSKGKLLIAENSSHDIPNDRPDLVIQSIHEVVQESQHA
jgi:hypothetical protein